ncbi:mitochondrial carrier protein [Aspergillus sclerotiicarbonarius CBS 121057]|uniref:Mitochondrial carrier protein n=1 Tax=Aspergillus sclerotiicarbonarius (strain CBS 121057 / IBT 28362) TaxID=1448318 RepID=A0A319DZC1_ASPSB|nr:mitochondrial carrier protein [Aspergillus sclerotiicarbonarius CBS 121057]
MASSAESFTPVYTPPGWRDNVKDLAAGATGGVAQVVIGQPFDLVKVRLQTQGGSGALSLTQQIWQREGPLAFYKGSLVPLLGVGACVSIQFSAFHYFQHQLTSHNRPPTLPQTYLSGALAGLTNSILSGPIEHIRIRLQTQPQAHPLYTGPWHCALTLLRTGGLPALYRGQTATLIREGHGIGIWFATYEGLLSLAAKRQSLTRESLPNWQIALCGALAGEMLWLLSHPIDVVKSRMQSDGFGKDQKYRSFREAWGVAVRGGGGGVWKGLGTALLRAGPVSGGTFVVVEMVRKVLG